MKFSLQALRYFVAVAEEGSVTRAARRLNISQPSVSGAISHLEQLFGQQLFVRKPAQGAFLTPAGERLVREARGLLGHAEEFEAMIGALDTELRGTLRAACFVNIAPVYFAGLLGGFRHRHPGIAVQFREGHQGEIFEGVRRGVFELALTFDLGDVREFECTVLAEIPPRAILADGHPMADQDCVSLHALKDEPFILLDLPHSRDYFLGLFESVGITPNLQYRTTSFEMARTLAGNGLGYGMLNLRPRTPFTYDGTKVVAVPIREHIRPLRIICIRLPEMPPRRVSRAFLSYAKAYFSGAEGVSMVPAGHGDDPSTGHDER